MIPYYEDARAGIALYHADARDVLASLRQASVDAVITDPPYSSGGMLRGDRQAAVSSKYVTSGARALPEFDGDTRDQRGFLSWCSLWLADAWRVASDGAIVAQFTDWRQLPVTTDALQAGGWVWRGIVVWDKTVATRPTLGGFRAQCEFIAWGSKGPMMPDMNPIALPGVLREPSDRDKIHIAQKPLGLMLRIVSVCRPGGLVLDPFAGTGTTLMAARETGRRAIGAEVNEKSCELAARRLAQESFASLGWERPKAAEQLAIAE